VHPAIVTLFASSVAAAASALGVLPLVGRDRVPETWIGWANALAGGMMFGTAFALGAVEGEVALPAALGAIGGILFIAWTHAATGTEDLALNRLGETGPDYGYRVALVQTLHAGSEGIAIGAAMAVGLPFGLFTAATMAVHNIPEVTYAVVSAAPATLSWVLGLATGMLANLVLVELLPESYRQAGSTSIAVVASAALAMVALLTAWVG
jgi:zinc transporter ZupT